MSIEESNPVVSEYEGHKIRNKNNITITLGANEYVKVLKASITTGLSIAKIVALQGQSCQSCGHDNVCLTIPKNLLSTKKAGSGGNISNKKHGN